MLSIFENFELEMSEEEATTMSHMGSVEADVVHFLKTNKSIQKQLDTIGAKPIAEELSRYGSWDDEELADVEANKMRIVWIAACNMTEKTEENS